MERPSSKWCIDNNVGFAFTKCLVSWLTLEKLKPATSWPSPAVKASAWSSSAFLTDFPPALSTHSALCAPTAKVSSQLVRPALTIKPWVTSSLNLTPLWKTSPQHLMTTVGRSLIKAYTGRAVPGNFDPQSQTVVDSKPFTLTHQSTPLKLDDHLLQAIVAIDDKNRRRFQIGSHSISGRKELVIRLTPPVPRNWIGAAPPQSSPTYIPPPTLRPTSLYAAYFCLLSLPLFLTKTSGGQVALALSTFWQRETVHSDAQPITCC